MGAAEYTAAGFNRTWFVPEPAQHAVPGTAQHAIYAVSWADTPGGVQYPLMWRDNISVNAYDVSQYYLEASSQARQRGWMSRAILLAMQTLRHIVNIA